MKEALFLIIPITLVYLPNNQDQKRTFLKIQCIFTLLLLEPHPCVITSDHWVINFLCWPVIFLTETDCSSGWNIKTYSLLNPFKEEFEAGPNTNQELFWTPARYLVLLNGPKCWRIKFDNRIKITFPLQHSNSVAQSVILTLQIISVFDNVLPPIII